MTYDATQEQYRIYAFLKENGDLNLVSTCGSSEALGVALVTHYNEGEFENATVGILFKPDPDQKGEWIASPYGATRKRRYPLSGDAPPTPPADT